MWNLTAINRVPTEVDGHGRQLPVYPSNHDAAGGFWRVAGKGGFPTRRHESLMVTYGASEMSGSGW